MGRGFHETHGRPKVAERFPALGWNKIGLLLAVSYRPVEGDRPFRDGRLQTRFPNHGSFRLPHGLSGGDGFSGEGAAGGGDWKGMRGAGNGLAGWRSLLGRGAAEVFFFGEFPFVRDGALFGAAGAAAFLAAEFLDGLGFGGGAAVGDGIELIAEFAAGEEAVHFTGALDLAFDGDAGGFVLEEDAVGGFVDFLAAGAGAADEFFREIGGEDAEGGHAGFEGGKFFGRGKIHQPLRR